MKTGMRSGLLLWLSVMLVSVAAAKDYNWEFKSPDVLEGWTLDELTDQGIVAGSLKVTATRGNPFIFTPKLERDAASQVGVKFRMRLGKGIRAKGCLLFVTEEQPQWDDRTIVSFACQADGEMHEYEVDLSKNPLWKGKVTQLWIPKR